jgi:hypothetical protein
VEVEVEMKVANSSYQAWHVGEGLALQFLERKSDILTQVDLSPVTPGCDAWNYWFEHERTHEPWNVEFDSGI